MLSQIGRQITRINIANFHKTPILYRINRQASTAKTIPQFLIKRQDDLLCYQQPDEVIKKINSLELDWQEKAFICNIGSRPDNFEFIKLILFKENNKNLSMRPPNLVPTNIRELPTNRKLYIKRLIQTDLDETKTELETVRKFINGYQASIIKLQNHTLSSMTIGIAGFVLASLSYETTSNFVLLGLLTSSGLGYITSGIYMITGKIMNKRYDLLVADDLIIKQYDSKIEKLEKVLAEFGTVSTEI